MRKEVKLAIFAIVTLALAIWGLKYLQGFNLFTPKLTVFAVYERVDGVRRATPVYINGLQVGLVADVIQMDESYNNIKVLMELDKGTKIPKSTVAAIYSELMGGTRINLVFEGGCGTDGCATDGAQIKGVVKGMLGSIATPSEIKPYLDSVNVGLMNILDSLEYKLKNSEELNKSMKDVTVILANLRNTTGRLDKMMAGNAGSIEASLKNVEDITGNLKSSNQQIKNILASAEILTGDLKNANVSGLTSEAKATMAKLQGTLANSDKAIAELDALIKGFKTGDGALPMLMNDPKFADDLKLTFNNLDLLLQDIRLHPERYRRILSKKKMPYEVPGEGEK